MAKSDIEKALTVFKASEPGMQGQDLSASNATTRQSPRTIHS